MNVAIDVQPIAGQRSGTGHYTDRVVDRFIRHGLDHRFFLCHYGLRASGRWIAGGDVASWELMRAGDFRGVSFPFQKAARMYSNARTRLAMRRAPVDLFWGPNYRTCFGRRFKTAVTIHDMAYHYYPHHIPYGALSYLKNRLGDVAARSHLVITISESTRNDLVRHLNLDPGKIVIAYPGVDSNFQPVADPEKRAAVRARYHLPDRFLLFLGTLEPRKNLVGLLNAYARARASGLDVPLVLAGGLGWMYRDIFRILRTDGLEHHVTSMGYIRDEDRAALYSMADVFVYPSFYEGFGLPVLEAMACGTPVVTSRVSSLPEVGGDAVFYVDPASVDNMASGLLKVAQSDLLRRTLSERGLKQATKFTWDDCARTIVAAFERVVHGETR